MDGWMGGWIHLSACGHACMYMSVFVCVGLHACKYACMSVRIVIYIICVIGPCMSIPKQLCKRKRNNIYTNSYMHNRIPKIT